MDGNSTEIGSLHYDLDVDDRKLDKTLNNSDKRIQRFKSTVQHMGVVLAASFAAATAAAVSFGISSMKAFAESEKAQKQLEHAVLNVSHATKEQLKQTSDLADELERKGVLDADNIKMGLAQLSTFGLSNKAVQSLAGSLSDLAVNQFGVSASGEQLSDTANTIAKALNGQFGVLEKSGIRFTEAQKKAIEFGTEMQKVDAINQGFAQNLKFTNAVALTTTEGKLAKMRVSLENVKESIGEVLAKALTPLAERLSNFVSSEKFQAWVEELNQWLAVKIPVAIDHLTEDVWPALVDAFKTAWPILQTLVEWFGKLFTFVTDNEWILWALVAGFAAVKTAMFLQGAFEAFNLVMGGAMKAGQGMISFLQNPTNLGAWGLIGVAAGLAAIAVFNAMQDAKKAVEDANRAIDNLKTAGEDAKQKIVSAMDAGKISVEKAQKALDAIDQDIRETKKEGGFSWSKLPGDFWRGLPGNAMGTDFWKGGWTKINERGPETVYLPRGSQIEPVEQKGSRGGTNVTIGVVNNQSDADYILRRLDRRQERLSQGLSPS